MTGHGDDRDVPPVEDLADLVDQPESALVGHRQVADHQIEVTRGERGERLAGAAGRLHAGAGRLERLADRFPRVAIIFDHEQVEPVEHRGPSNEHRYA